MSDKVIDVLKHAWQETDGRVNSATFLLEQARIDFERRQSDLTGLVAKRDALGRELANQGHPMAREAREDGL